MYVCMYVCVDEPRQKTRIWTVTVRRVVHASVTGTIEGTNLVVASLHAGRFTLLINETDIFSLFFYMLESLRLIPFTLQLNQAVFYPLSPSNCQSSKTVRQDLQSFQNVVPDTWSTKLCSHCRQAFHHEVKLGL
jgi:hypothetical protein